MPQSALCPAKTKGRLRGRPLHPERELALKQHGFTVAEVIEGTRLEDMTVAELRDIAAVEGIDLPTKGKKADIIAAINAADLPVME